MTVHALHSRNAAEAEAAFLNYAALRREQTKSASARELAMHERKCRDAYAEVQRLFDVLEAS